MLTLLRLRVTFCLPCVSFQKDLCCSIEERGGCSRSCVSFGEGGRGKSKSPDSFVSVGRRQNTPSMANLIFTFNRDRDVNILLLGHPCLLIVWFPVW